MVFSIDGERVTVFSAEGIELDGAQRRDDYYDVLPPIFVDSPAWGQPVMSPIQVQGLSNVFEAVSQVMLTDDDGEPLYEDDVMATCGTGCWGEWQTEISYEVDREQFGALIVWEFSAEDGTGSTSGSTRSSCTDFGEPLMPGKESIDSGRAGRQAGQFERASAARVAPDQRHWARDWR